MTTMCSIASSPEGPEDPRVAQATTMAPSATSTATGSPRVTRMPPCILRICDAESARKALPMLDDGSVGQDAEQLFRGGRACAQPLVCVLRHAEGGALRARADLVERRPPGDESNVLLVGHPEIGHHHAAAIAAEAALRTAGALEEAHGRRHRIEDLA